MIRKSYEGKNRINLDWHIQPRLRLFTLEQHILIQLALVLRCQHIRHGLVFCNVQYPVQAVGHIKHISVVHKVNHQQILFARTAACATAKLLQIDCFGHGRARHEQHRGMRAVPAFVQKVTGAKNIGRAGFIVLQDFFRTSTRSRPETASAFTPLSRSNIAISAAWSTLAQKITVFLPLTYFR